MQSTTHLIVNGDSRQMSELATQSVHLTVTSPPYWQLKDYGTDNQIGFNESYESYINQLNLVWQECHRVLCDGCRLCVNIGDQFARSVYYGRYKVIPIHSEIIRFCETIGFDFMGQIIWQKATTMNTTGGGSVMGSYPYPRNGIVKLDSEYILLFKKQGTAPKPTPEQKAASVMTGEEWNAYFSGHWNFPGVRQDKHLAMFPEELPKRLIKMFSFVGETVLDPFLGSGTTSAAAKALGRNSTGYEINPEFMPIIRERLAPDTLFSTGTVRFVVQESKAGFEEEMERLPYRFTDVHKIDKKIDVKQLQFGSAIDKESSKKREELFSVQEVLSPELVSLSNGVTIRLLGVRQDKSTREAAVSFLRDLVKGKRVYLKFDQTKYDSENHLLGYLYLENRTFVNAHLLKRKLALPETDLEYKYKDKFLNL